jgi:hypothetical protein
MRWQRWRRRFPVTPTEILPVAEVRAQLLADQVEAVRRSNQRVRRSRIVLGIGSVILFGGVVALTFTVNTLTFGVQHGSHTPRPAIAKLMRIAVSSSDSFVILAALLALAAAIAIAQQAATDPSPEDVQGVARALTWQSSTSEIALVSGMFAMQVGLSQWVTGDIAERWVSDLFATVLAGLTLAMAATLREWSDQSLVRAMRRSELDERIGAIEKAEKQLPLLSYRGTSVVRRYLLPPVELGFLLSVLFVVLTGIVGEVDLTLVNWQSYLVLVAVTAVGAVILGVGGAIAGLLRVTQILRDWSNLGFVVLVAVVWLTGGISWIVSILFTAEQWRDWEVRVVVGGLAYLTLVPALMYAMSGRTARWPASLIIAIVGDALKRLKTDLLFQRDRLDDESGSPAVGAVGHPGAVPGGQRVQPPVR